MGDSLRAVIALHCLVVVAAIGLVSAQAHCVEYTWTGNNNSDFGKAANWNPAGGPPVAADSVLIDKPGIAFDIEFGNDCKNQSLTLNAGSPTLKLALKTYELTSPVSLTVGGANGRAFPTLKIVKGKLKANGALITGTAGIVGGKSDGTMILDAARFETWGTMSLSNTPDTSAYVSIEKMGVLANMFDAGTAARIGEVEDAKGYVYIKAGGEWFCRGQVDVGFHGEGHIFLNHDGFMNATRSLVSLGVNATGVGIFNVDGVAELGKLYVGENGTGALIVGKGAALHTLVASIGLKPDSSGRVTVRGTAANPSKWMPTSITVGGGATAGGKGTLNIEENGLVEVFSAHGFGPVKIWPKGIIRGNSKIVAGLLTNDGAVEPGDGAGKGTLTLDLKEYSQTNQGAIICKLSKVDVHSKLAFAGNNVKVNFAGKLVLKNMQAGAFAVPAGAPHEIKIMEWPANATIQGQFATIEKFDLPAGFEWDMAKLYTDGVVTIKAAAAGGNCDADLNGDSVVNEIDLGILKQAMGPCQGACEADLNDDGMINASDLIILLGAWGACPM